MNRRNLFKFLGAIPLVGPALLKSGMAQEPSAKSITLPTDKGTTTFTFPSSGIITCTIDCTDFHGHTTRIKTWTRS